MKKIAIIGGGVAGVCAAHLFQHQYDVTLFEKSHYLGGNNTSFEVIPGVSVPMAVIIFPREKVFPMFSYFAKAFNLPLRRIALPHVFLCNNQIKYALAKIPISNMGWSWSRFYQEFKNFTYLLCHFREKNVSSSDTVAELIRDKKLSLECAHYFLLPFAALYMSVPYRELLTMPVSVIAHWWQLYSLPIYAMQMYRYIEGGNHQLIDAFKMRTKMTLRLKSSIQKIKRHSNSVTLVLDDGNMTFDKVIIATPPDVAYQLLEQPTPDESSILTRLETRTVCSTLHRNPTFCHQGVMTINVLTSPDQPPSMTSTWGQNACFGYQLAEEHYVTIHEPHLQLIPEKDRIHQQYLRVVQPTLSAMHLRNKMRCLNQNHLNTYFCGSYFKGFYYHENAIQSALDIAAIDGVDIRRLLNHHNTIVV